MADQVISISEQPAIYAELEKLRKVVFTWKCTDAGVVADQTAAGQINKTTQKFTGRIIRFITDPVDGPTDNYDVVVLDDDGYDVLMGAGADRHTTLTQQVLESSLGCCYSSQLRLNIAAAGNAKSGIVILYIE